MLIKVQLTTGQSIPIAVDNEDTVAIIKQKLQQEIGVHQAQQKLVYLAQGMNDNKTVAEYKLKAGATLQLIVNLRGG